MNTVRVGDKLHREAQNTGDATVTLEIEEIWISAGIGNDVTGNTTETMIRGTHIADDHIPESPGLRVTPMAITLKTLLNWLAMPGWTKLQGDAE